MQVPIIVSRKRREVDLDFSECEGIDKPNQTKTETLTYDTDAMDNLEELERLQTFTCLDSTGKHI